MGRGKLEKFAVNATRRNVVEPGKELYEQLKGRWNSDFFQNSHPIILEVGCGKGEYTIGMAERYPEKNFVGIDIKGNRIWKGSTMAEEAGLQNVGFLRIFIENLDQHFGEQEVDEIWITFPDPRPRKRDIKRRLTSPRFLEMYERILKPGGKLHLKTDSASLFEYSVEVLTERNVNNFLHTWDLYSSDLQEHTMGIYTTFEKTYLEQEVPIKYLQYTL
ncbi:tRNA (guanosine(46)-N7)-methyltransferase TrmB [Rufibacter glacialis]|uniref:tRNA (guanine-N(7)-)-methyltransferase n=1 Tax=Rufibacter glacialis TaxID=1259555 RepID=A0A5M8QH02_9BACT|nr:tRNA (guanosine(46)-N7)-methyltransferase TrmB [Rufibacter glacialis]KAA6434210.1 tRNA (guanosine(46)-N7)-methyltransferase TrmB [Rufibacter glacialis]GGK67764.1 tRNA (guanine-N(7)-)-methyltransferase [Rufibacter glacialis]